MTQGGTVVLEDASPIRVRSKRVLFAIGHRDFVESGSVLLEMVGFGQVDCLEDKKKSRNYSSDLRYRDIIQKEQHICTSFFKNNE